MKDSAAGGPANGMDVCAVVVTYHPDPQLPARLAGVLRQVGAVVIVDNGSGDAELKMLRELSADPKITLTLNSANLGIARALNIGMKRAAALNYAWVLLLDQDTIVDEDMVQALIGVYAAFPDKDRLAVIGSAFRDANVKPRAAGDQAQAHGGEREEPAWEDAECVITSGSLLPWSTHAAIGPFREEFFIDHVDIEYCFRARAKGFRVLKTRRPVMSHAIGATTEHNWLWLNKWTTNHSPDRRYYFARNDTVLLREYGNYRFGTWALKSLGRRIRMCKRIALYEQMKSRKMLAVAQGWWDGVRGRLGPRV